MGKKKKRLKNTFIIASVFSAITVAVTFFKDVLEIYDKSTDADISISIDRKELDGFSIMSFGNERVFPHGVNYSMLLSHNHQGKDPIIVRSIKINAKKISSNNKCQSFPNLDKIKGAGTITAMIFRTSIYSENKITTKLLLKNGERIVTNNDNILGHNSTTFIKLNDSNDDTEIIKGYIMIKEKGIFKISFNITYSISSNKKSLQTEGTYLCL